MYDQRILGHELAGRPALTVAMKTGRVPLVELNEVYRAPPSLIEPYNRLAYEGRLVSRKVRLYLDCTESKIGIILRCAFQAEGDCPLGVMGLIHAGLPQLLLIDVDGKEQRNEKTMSLYNEKELDVLVR